jgi:hypothetical protein
VIGLEPSNSSVYGRPYHEKQGNLHMLRPFAKEKTSLTYSFFDGKEEIEKEIQNFKNMF